MSGFDIQYIPHLEIDKRKWDQSIEHAENSLIYAYSYYLDMMAENWDALVWEDYKIVMPLTWKKKYGIHYLCQPFLTAQLGVFGNNVSPQMVESFITAIPGQFKLIEIALNSSNHTTKHIHATSRNNFVLDLNHSYEEIYSRYNDNIKRNIKKAKEAGSAIKIGVAVDELVEMAIAQMMRSYKQESPDNVKRFRKLYDHLHHNNSAVTYGIQTKELKLVAAAAFFITHHRAYYILVGNTAESKLTGASHFLVDAFIRDHAGKELKLDFEGSDIQSLAFFYSGFGAENEKYPFLKINRLPFYLRWLKK